jgi:hypothetical protein
MANTSYKFEKGWKRYVYIQFSQDVQHGQMMLVSQVALILNLGRLPPNGPIFLHHSEQMRDI